MNRTLNDWVLHFLRHAQLVSEMSKDPSTKVGAVIVTEGKFIKSTGYNGFPVGIKDDSRLHTRETKYEMIIHAEINAILTAGCHGKSVKGDTLYVWPMPPCQRCASQIIQSGIKRIVSYHPDNERWLESCNQGDKLFEEAGIESVWYILKN